MDTQATRGSSEGSSEEESDEQDQIPHHGDYGYTGDDEEDEVASNTSDALREEDARSIFVYSDKEGKLVVASCLSSEVLFGHPDSRYTAAKLREIKYDGLGHAELIRLAQEVVSDAGTDDTRGSCIWRVPELGSMQSYLKDPPGSPWEAGITLDRFPDFDEKSGVEGSLGSANRNPEPGDSGESQAVDPDAMDTS